MKRLVLLLAFVIISANSFAQSLGLDDLVKIMKLSPTETNEYLTAKGWEFNHSEADEPNGQATVRWSFGADEEDSGNADKWLGLTYSEGAGNLMVAYNSTSDADYNTIKKKIGQYKMDKIKTFVADNAMVDVYQGANYVIQIQTQKHESGEILKGFILYKKEDYLSNNQ